jgi:hypothetical protein
LSIPVETVQPQTIRNPFANEARPVSTPQDQPVRMKKASKNTLKNKTTWVKNPFFDSDV